MNPRQRILLLILIMFSIVLSVETITIGTLYKVAISEEKSRLVEIVKSQARLIEAVARFDKNYSGNYPFGPRQATISQIKDARTHYRGFGKTGEFVLSTRENDQIVFLLSHRLDEFKKPVPVPWNSKLAEPMRLALSGKSGTIIDFDYRGKKVLAAYEPLPELNLSIVAKIDMAEVRAPFLRATLMSGFSMILLVSLGVSLFSKISNPMLKGLYDTVAKLEKAIMEVKTLRGILPICSFCKKIRDDKGCWNQVEVYIKERLDADFSHSICPVCMKKHYPEEYEAIQSKKVDHGTTKQS